MPLRKSTGRAAQRMRTPGGTGSTPGPAPPRAPGAAPRRPHPCQPAPRPGQVEFLCPAHGLGRCGPILRQRHRHEPRRAARLGPQRRAVQLLPPDDELASVSPGPRATAEAVVAGSRLSATVRAFSSSVQRRRRPISGDDLEPAEAPGFRASRRTVSTHRSKARRHPSGPTSSTSSADPQGGLQTAVTSRRSRRRRARARTAGAPRPDGRARHGRPRGAPRPA